MTTQQMGGLTTNLTWAELTQRLRANFHKWGIREYMVPALKSSDSMGGAVSVEYMVHGQWQVATCGKWNRASDGRAAYRNFHALVLALESVRLADQRGIAGVFAEIAQHFALPEANDSSPYTILRVAPDASSEQIRSAYRRRMSETHPDHGGDAKEFDKVRAAGRAIGVA